MSKTEDITQRLLHPDREKPTRLAHCQAISFAHLAEVAVIDHRTDNEPGYFTSQERVDDIKAADLRAKRFMALQEEICFELGLTLQNFDALDRLDEQARLTREAHNGMEEA